MISNAPVVAFYDSNMIDRYIDALKSVIQGKRLQLSTEGNGTTTNAEVQHQYEELFYLACEKSHDIFKNDFKILNNEIIVSNCYADCCLFFTKSLLV